ncbi:acetyl/propionyl-CoA carboxylase alpha subunit [Rhodoferax ferrireducens]|uniref:Acetyl/propionyl-CoA carboxylase alpha subunit n=1 Tax=Rhodoferax ferrireducens TaxID=192843 RepID=A0ABU2CF74_9BURK|nr:hypothetical protein [Rhodoferax ferrireducens]MDR7380007.1 acetyl/propionyl-CoA carboxylase alpha subunit [Rhodoferax ferrireducens]
MFEKILIANRGDQRLRRAAAKLHCLAHVVCADDLTAKEAHV